MKAASKNHNPEVIAASAERWSKCESQERQGVHGPGLREGQHLLKDTEVFKKLEVPPGGGKGEKLKGRWI